MNVAKERSSGQSSSFFRRLNKELLELKHCPLSDVWVHPVGPDDLREWHGSIRASASSTLWEGIVIHFKIVFGASYPQTPPKVSLFSHFPHLNVIGEEGLWTVCLDMLQLPPLGAPAVPYQYWSSGFSIRSILMQMLSFILCDGESVPLGQVDACRQAALQFVCPCCYASDLRFPHEDAVQKAPVAFPLVNIDGERLAKVQDAFGAQDSGLRTPSVDTKQCQHNSFEEILVSDNRNLNAMEADEGNKSLPKRTRFLRPQTKLLSSAKVTSTPVVNSAQVKGVAKVGSLSAISILPRDVVAGFLTSFLDTRDILSLRGVSKGCRALMDDPWVWRRQLERDFPKSALRPGKRSHQCPMAWKHSYMLEKNGLSDELKCFYSFNTRHDDVLGIPLEFTINPKWNQVDCVTSTFDVIGYSSYYQEGVRRTLWGRRFSSFLPLYIDEQHFDKALELLLQTAEKLLNRPKVSETAPMASGRDGSLIDIDRSAIDTNWRTAVKPSLPAPREAVAYNPRPTDESWRKKREPAEPKNDSIRAAGSDLNISVKKMSGVQRKEKISNRNSIKPLGSVVSILVARTECDEEEMKQWCPKSRQDFALTLIIKLMNTQVLLLCDKGVSVSDKALFGYCQLHRLMIALVDRFPDLRNLINCRLKSFISNPGARVKSITPSLGDIFCMLSVSTEVTWKDLFYPVMLESLDRSVFWSCVRDPSLASLVPGDISRMTRVLEAQRVSLRIKAFHSIFINTLISGGGSSSAISHCADTYDLFLGRPPLHLQRRWRSCVEIAIKMQSWEDYFSICQIPAPSSELLLSLLEGAVANSLKKGYHSLNTKFENVHRSGVSRILLNGESYTTAPNIRRISLIEKWKFSDYLDASCLLFDFNGQLIGEVDYRNRSWGPGDCIRHSGDVINGGDGSHSVRISVDKLPKNLCAIFFIVSAWRTTLKSISQPSCYLHDPDRDAELCRYKLENTDTSDYTSVIMCCFRKASPLPESRWQMKTIGHLGYGRADEYAPIIKVINDNYLSILQEAIPAAVDDDSDPSSPDLGEEGHYPIGDSGQPADW